MPEIKSSDEIDLREVVRKLKQLFNGFLSFIGGVFRLILRRWAYFLLVTALGLGAAYLLYVNTRPYYSYSMTAVPSGIRNDFVQGMISNLTMLVNEKNYKEVAKQLTISEDKAENIKSVYFRNLEKVEEDSLLAGSPFAVDVELYSNAIHDTIEAGIIRHLETNQYYAKQRQIKKEHLESLVGKLRKDIAAIDSSKMATISPRGPVNGFVYGEPLDPTNLYKESVVMYERQTFLEANLKRLESFDVIVHFAPKLGPSGPNLNKYLAIGALSALLLGLIFALYREKQRIQPSPEADTRF